MEARKIEVTISDHFKKLGISEKEIEELAELSKELNISLERIAALLEN